jgi:hypothetical protein
VGVGNVNVPRNWQPRVVTVLGLGVQSNSKAIFDNFFTADGQSKVQKAALSNATTNGSADMKAPAGSSSAKR